MYTYVYIHAYASVVFFATDAELVLGLSADVTQVCTEACTEACLCAACCSCRVHVCSHTLQHITAHYSTLQHITAHYNAPLTRTLLTLTALRTRLT
jgi:hypothetical protein